MNSYRCESSTKKGNLCKNNQTDGSIYCNIHHKLLVSSVETEKEEMLLSDLKEDTKILIQGEESNLDEKEELLIKNPSRDEISLFQDFIKAVLFFSLLAFCLYGLEERNS
jgi:hypothetical protein